jgi:hypothetical protein
MAIRITGSGVALTVGIILVTALIIGGFFLAKNSGEQARREESIKIAEQNLEEQSNEGVALNEGENSNESNTSGDDAAKDEAAKQEAAKNESTNGNSNSSSNQSSNQATGELPATGPADQLVNVVVLALLTFSVVSYISSRRQVYNGFLMDSNY